MDKLLKEQASAIEFRREGALRLYVNRDFLADELLADLMRLPDILAGLSGRSSRAPGRETVWQWRPEWLGGGSAVVRESAHGGLFGPLLGGLFLGAGRMLQEFRLTLYALSRGVRTCRPIALRVEKGFGPLVRVHYLTEKIESSANLLEFCAGLGSRPPQGQFKACLARRLAETIAAMHDIGIYHADLNVKNLLVKDPLGELEVFVVDFDKTRLKQRLSLSERLANLSRLDRSVLKWLETRRVVTRLDRLRVLREYLQLCPQWAGEWKAIARRIRTRHLRHLLSRKHRAQQVDAASAGELTAGHKG